MADSTNDGFAVINPETKECKVRLLGQISDCKADDANDTENVSKVYLKDIVNF